MLADGRKVDRAKVLSFDVCIVGGGPAGLTLADEFSDGRQEVCLLESGGFHPDPAVQALNDYEVTESDDLYPNPLHNQVRAIGGTSHEWCVDLNDEKYFRAARLQPSDFKHRSWLANSGWPIGTADLAPFYARAERRCGIEPNRYDSSALAELDRNEIFFPHGSVTSPVFRFGRQSLFLDVLPRQLENSKNITVLTNSTAVELVTSDNGVEVQQVLVRCLGGNEFHIAAKVIILAQGAHEVPRLLLASRSATANGLGNQHDLVGRFYMDHQLVKAGHLRPLERPLAAALGYYDIRATDLGFAGGQLALSEKTLDHEQILSSSLMFVPHPATSAATRLHRLYRRETTVRSRAHGSALALKRSAQNKVWPAGIGGHILNIVREGDDLVFIKTRSLPYFRPRHGIDDAGWFDDEDRDRTIQSFDTYLVCEQAPDRSNRITLTRDVDQLGMPKPALSFHWSEIDLASACRSQEIYRSALSAAGTGQLEYERRNGYPAIRQMSTHHPAGTTRMSNNPSEGVVDGDCRVHGTKNLYVASSAVFPTSGYAAPTLTILALAIRIADTVKAQISHSARSSSLNNNGD